MRNHWVKVSSRGSAVVAPGGRVPAAQHAAHEAARQVLLLLELEDALDVEVSVECHPPIDSVLIQFGAFTGGEAGS